MQTKNEYGKKHIQGAVLRERQQGEKRYCPHYGTGYNQRNCGAVQLQAEHPEIALGRERQQGERQEPRGTGHQSCVGQHQGANHQTLPAHIRP